MLSGEIARRYGHAGLKPDTHPHQLHRGRRAELRRLARPRRHARPDRRRQRLCRQGPVGRPRRSSASRTASSAIRRDNIIVGNTVLYGAIAGEAYLQRRRRRALRGAQLGRGRGGRRLRRSWLRIHDRRRGRACSARPGATSRPGMSGGVAYVYDEDGAFAQLCNLAQVDLPPVSAARDEEDGTGRPQQRAAQRRRLRHGRHAAPRRRAAAHPDRAAQAPHRQRARRARCSTTGTTR